MRGFGCRRLSTDRVDIKELKIRPATDVHDYQVRLRSARNFLSKVIIMDQGWVWWG
jgi:translation initiation factor IF-3